MLHREPELRLQALRDQRAVAGLRIGLDAHERCCAIDGHRLDDRPEGDPAENLLEVPLPILGGEPTRERLRTPSLSSSRYWSSRSSVVGASSLRCRYSIPASASAAWRRAEFAQA